MREHEIVITIYETSDNFEIYTLDRMDIWTFFGWFWNHFVRISNLLESTPFHIQLSTA